MQKVPADHKLYKIAFLVALACVLQISESLIPHPVPGLRLGLANMLTLTAMLVLGFRSALEVAILRTLLSSFIMGTFMSPTFLLSFASAVISTLAMGLLYWLSGFHDRYRFSIIGISIVGAFTHNMVQLYLAYLLLVKHSGIFIFFPWLGIGAVGTGWVVGLVAGGVYRRLQENPDPAESDQMQPEIEGFELRCYAPGTSILHRLPAEIKIAAMFAMAMAILLYADYRFYLGMLLILSMLTLASKTPFVFLYARARRYTSLLCISFMLPLFFNSGTHTLFTVVSLEITQEGIRAGAIFASRILLLIIASALLMRTTSPDELTRGLARVLSPLGFIGISSQRIAAILSLSWTAIPQLWTTTRRAIFSARVKRAKDMRNLLYCLSNLIAILYLKTEPDHKIWESAKPGQENGDICPGSF